MTRTTCPAGQYIAGFANGTYNSIGAFGMCNLCSMPSGLGQYVSTACTAMADTRFTTVSCPTGQYARGFVAGTYSNVGVAGTCSNCYTPTGLQYVTNVCTLTSNTVVAIGSACPAGQYFRPGSYGMLGDPTCRACSNPDAVLNQYVTAICTTTADTQFSIKQTCTGNKTLSGFSAGSYSSLGNAGTCR